MSQVLRENKAEGKGRVGASRLLEPPSLPPPTVLAFIYESEHLIWRERERSRISEVQTNNLVSGYKGTIQDGNERSGKWEQIYGSFL